jgi:hypothetical protein
MRVRDKFLISERIHISRLLLFSMKRTKNVFLVGTATDKRS